MSDDPDSSPATIEVSISDPQWTDVLPDAGGLVRAAVTAALSLARGPLQGPSALEVSIALADDSCVRRLNKRYRKKDQPTNVLSFPGPEATLAAPGLPPLLLGDVVLARQTVFREAKEQGKSVEQHTLHLIVHGILHLLGYDHSKSEEAEEMERLEREILARLGLPDPYLCVTKNSESDMTMGETP